MTATDFRAKRHCGRRRRPRGAPRSERATRTISSRSRSTRRRCGARPSSPRSAPAPLPRPSAETIAPAAQAHRPDRPVASNRLAALAGRRARRRPSFLPAPAAHRRDPGGPVRRLLGRDARRPIMRPSPASALSCLWMFADGTSDGAAAPRLGARMSFGRKGVGGQSELAERRAAFLAAERARQSSRRRQDHPAHSEPVFVREKSTGTAYLLWFFLGGLSAHRFYLGFPVSGAIQAALLPISWALSSPARSRPSCRWPPAGSGSCATPS